jgi:hypothetical protein
MHCGLSAEQEQLFQQFKESLNTSIDYDFPTDVIHVYVIYNPNINSFFFFFCIAINTVSSS